MSKITIIGGDLIEEISGSYKIYAEEGFEISSGKEVIFNAKEGIKYGPPKTIRNSKNKYDKPTYYLWFRSFISAKSLRDPLGRKFDGDDRKPSLSFKKEITSRGKAKLTVNLETEDVKISDAKADITHMRPYYRNDVVKDIGKIYYKLNV